MSPMRALKIKVRKAAGPAKLQEEGMTQIKIEKLDKTDIETVVKLEKKRVKKSKVEFGNKLRLLTANKTYKINIKQE